MEGLLTRSKRPPDRTVTIRAPEKVLRYLAFMVQDYFEANPAMDNGEIAMGDLDPRIEGQLVLRQMRDQGIEPAERKE